MNYILGLSDMYCPILMYDDERNKTKKPSIFENFSSQ
jgi:hypothetical protein